MPSHAAWKGYVRVSLVSIPVAAFTAASRHTARGIEMNQLHATCKSRIRYKKVCPIHGEVSSDEIVSGYEYAEGQYAVIDKAEIDEIRLPGDKSLSVDAFVPGDSIDPVYLSGQTYYLTPDGPVGEKPYALFREALDEEQLHAVGKVVISRRERLVRLRASGPLLAMDVMQFEAETKPRSAFEDEVPTAPAAAHEKKLTKSLLEAMTVEAFDPTQYKDDYVERMTELIQAKVQGHELVSPPPEEEPSVINLMDALRESVKRISKPGAAAPKKAATKKTAASKPAAEKRSAPAKKAASSKKPARPAAASVTARGAAKAKKKSAKRKSG